MIGSNHQGRVTRPRTTAISPTSYGNIPGSLRPARRDPDVLEYDVPLLHVCVGPGVAAVDARRALTTHSRQPRALPHRSAPARRVVVRGD